MAVSGEQLTELFKKAQSAAERANSDAEEDRCVEALQAMRSLSITTAVLMSTQVGRQLRKLTKHSSQRIKSMALDILDDWKKLVTSENGKGEAKSKPPESSSNGGSKPPPSKSRALPKCGNAARDKVREILVEAFEKVPQEAGAGEMNRVRAADPVQVAVDVETTLFSKLSKPTDKAKSRSILFNIKDPNNPDLRRRLLLGDIPPAQLTRMSAEEMASDQRKAENKQIKDKALFECERGMKQEATTDQFKCGKCGKRECTYFQKQTRSADEPMTTFVTCVNCNNNWKFC